MRKNRAAIALSAAALVFAVLGQTSIGQAAVGAVRVALFAQNSARVNDIQASRKPVPGRLLALNARGQFPSSVLPASRAGDPYTHTVIVHPDPDPLVAGENLIRALEAISNPSAANPYLVKIEPGIYDLGAGSLYLRPYIDVEGSGEGVTTITSSVPTGFGTVVGADNSELRFLTVKNTGEAGQQVVALFSERASPRYSHLRVVVSGGAENQAIHISNGAPVLDHVVASATGGGTAIGVMNLNAALTVSGSTFSAADATGANTGYLSSMGGTSRATDSTMTASGGEIAAGVKTNNGVHTLVNMTVSGSGATTSYGIYNGWRVATPAVNVHQSRIAGWTNSVFSFGGPVKVGASQLTGPLATTGTGTVTCAASYNENYVALTPGCEATSSASGRESSRRGR
jgi:hypothetical protein